MDDKTTRFNAESSAVQAHLTLMQGIIQRIAENSRSCKTWCITIVSAVLVLVVWVEKPDYTLIALIPTILFLFLDTYYLALERGFRASYEIFVEKLHKGELILSNFYSVTLTGSTFGHFLSSLLSFSILPFYPTLAVMIWLVWYFMIP